MEVASLLTNCEADISQIEKYLNNCSNLKYMRRDNDTVYYSGKKAKTHELYFHFMPNNIDEEFSYNYSDRDIRYIRKFFNDEKFFLVDISYRHYDLIVDLLKDFYINIRNSSYHKTLLHIEEDFIVLANSPSSARLI